MQIGGLHKLSLIDYPGHLCAVVFTQGCNFRCPVCHNPELVLPELFGESISEQEVLSFLESRKGQLQAVTVTGGEPTLQKKLPYFLATIKKMGYKTKLDTNGSYPEALKSLFNDELVDYVAMDIKAPLASYYELSGCTVDLEAIQQSIELILSSPVRHQFRTTIDPARLSQMHNQEIRQWMKQLGARHSFQTARFGKTLDQIL
jgi:pyruvate formate lyase activating enzyme